MSCTKQYWQTTIVMLQTIGLTIIILRHSSSLVMYVRVLYYPILLDFISPLNHPGRYNIYFFFQLSLYACLPKPIVEQPHHPYP